jgi:hypothetical protein
VVALIDRANNRLVIAADYRVDRDSASRSGCKIIHEPGCLVRFVWPLLLVAVMFEGLR